MELALKDQVSSRFNKIAKEYASLEKLKKSIEKKMLIQKILLHPKKKIYKNSYNTH